MATIVTPDNFLRAETDLYFSALVKDGGFGKLFHNREMSPIDHQNVIRQNRDTLYSAVVLDLDVGPATVALPDAGGRFMSLQIIDQDQYVPAVYYDSAAHRLTRDEIGTRYVMATIRTLADPNDPADLAEANRLQDGIRLEQPGGPGTFEVPQWDSESQNKVRAALHQMAQTMPDTSKGFGPRGEVDPVQRLVGGPWAGAPIPRRTPATSMSRQNGTTGKPCTG